MEEKIDGKAREDVDQKLCSRFTGDTRKATYKELKVVVVDKDEYRGSSKLLNEPKDWKKM